MRSYRNGLADVKAGLNDLTSTLHKELQHIELFGERLVLVRLHHDFQGDVTPGLVLHHARVQDEVNGVFNLVGDDDVVHFTVGHAGSFRDGVSAGGLAMDCQDSIDRPFEVFITRRVVESGGLIHHPGLLFG